MTVILQKSFAKSYSLKMVYIDSDVNENHSQSVTIGSGTVNDNWYLQMACYVVYPMVPVYFPHISLVPNRIQEIT